MSKECTDRFDAGSRCRTGGRRMIRNRPDRTARGRISPRPGAATVRFAPQDTPPARIHSVRRTHTNEKPRRNSAGLLTDRSDIWRKRRDSNPRYPFEVYTLSRRAPSTARTLFPDRPLRRTRASGDQTCRKVRKFLKIKKYRRRICAFRTNAHLSPADRYAARPLRYRTAPASRPVPPSYSGSPALPLSILSLLDINIRGRSFKSQKIGVRPTGSAARSGQIVSRRPRPDPIDRLRFRECNKQDETATGRPFSCGVSFPAHLFYADETCESVRTGPVSATCSRPAKGGPGVGLLVKGKAAGAKPCREP